MEATAERVVRGVEGGGGPAPVARGLVFVWRGVSMGGGRVGASIRVAFGRVVSSSRRPGEAILARFGE
jgi:hypothetical protein